MILSFPNILIIIKIRKRARVFSKGRYLAFYISNKILVSNNRIADKPCMVAGRVI
jgi:hypothetical protein